MKNREHILVIRFSTMSEIAMMVPVVYSVAMKYPETRITVLSRHYIRPLFDDLASNVNFMEADFNEYHGVKGLNALYRRLVAKQFTHIADLNAEWRSKYLRARFNMGTFRVEHLKSDKRLVRKLTRKNNKVKVQLPSLFDKYLNVFEKLGFPIDELTFTSLFPPEGGNLNMLPRIIGVKRSWEQWIGIAPFAGYEGKTYPKEKMEQVIDMLSVRYPKARFFLFGKGKDAEETFPQWGKNMPQCVCVNWHLENLHQEMILMSHLDVMVSMDAATMHLASLTATPVVSIWGATDPLNGHLGYHQTEKHAVSLDLSCRPCSLYGQKPCIFNDYHCLGSIMPNMIVDHVTEVINNHAKTQNH